MAVLIFGGAAYFVQQSIVNILLRPAHGQHFIYTSPGGGISFLFKVCTDVGLILSLPVLVYEVLGFLTPLLDHHAKRFIVQAATVSALLGTLGIAFGYFLGLPLALHFLSHQFTTSQITPLLTISEYMTFVTVYLFGSALLFQIPLVLIIINRIRPQKPQKLLKLERYVIVAAFVVAMIMAPTVNIIDQLLIAGPIIVVYQVGIVLIWQKNRKSRYHRPKQVTTLLQQDRLVQAERIRLAQEARAQLAQRSAISRPVANRRPMAKTAFTQPSL